MDKHLVIMVMLLLGGSVIGIAQMPPRLELFYGGIAGAIIIFIYASMKNRREQQALRRERRKRR